MTQTLTHTINRVFMRPHFIGAAKFVARFKKWYRFFFYMMGLCIFILIVIGIALPETSEWRKSAVSVLMWPLAVGVALTFIGAAMHIVWGIGLRRVKKEMAGQGYDITTSQADAAVAEMVKQRDGLTSSYWHFWGNHPGIIVGFAVIVAAFVISIIQSIPVMAIFCGIVAVVILLYSWMWHQNQVDRILKEERNNPELLK